MLNIFFFFLGKPPSEGAEGADGYRVFTAVGPQKAALAGQMMQQSRATPSLPLREHRKGRCRRRKLSPARLPVMKTERRQPLAHYARFCAVLCVCVYC